MKPYSLSHLSDQTLLHRLDALIARDRATTAELLAHLSEVEERRLYAAAGFPSMHAYCVGKLHFSDDAAYKRIHAARLARQFPVLFAAVADGRLHLTAVLMLGTSLTKENAAELVAAATHRSKPEIEVILAQRFPRPDIPTLVEALPAPAPGPSPPPAPAQAAQLAPERVAAPPPQPRVTPLAPQRFGVQFTMDQETHDLLRQAQDLLGHRVPAGDVAAVFKRALQALLPQLQRLKFGATAKPRPGRSARPSANSRNIPDRVKRAVWKRDGGRCTFVSETGKRCEERKALELDHIEAVARGGQSTVGNLRLRCRAHNQCEAERTFGADFMRHKREEARRVAEELRAVRSASARQATDEVRRMAADAGSPGSPG